MGRLPLAVVFVVLLLFAGYAMGRAYVALAPLLAPSSPVPTSVAEPTTIPLPTEDVAGNDLPRLPRYPGAIRTEYREFHEDAVPVIHIEYLARAETNDVRLFYRRIFSEQGWTVADLRFEFGQWVYLLVGHGQELEVEITPRAGLLEIAMEQRQIVQPAQPRPPAPPAAPPDDDDDDDGSWDD
jgi:hypothetical protein